MKKIIIGVFSLILATGMYAQTIGNEAFPQLKDGLLDLNLRTPGQKLRFGGFPAWAVWLFVHLMSIVGVKNRLFIFVDWMWSYFTYDPSLRIIIKPLKRE